MNIKNTYLKYRTYCNIIAKDAKDKFPLPFLKKVELWRKGFLAEKFTLYNFKENKTEEYFSDFHASMARNINNPFNDVLTNKLIFSEFVGKVIAVPETFGAIINGKYHPNTTCFEEVLNKSKIVIKGITGGGGNSVYILEKIDEKLFFLNKEKIEKEKIIDFIQSLDNFIITEFIEPGQFSRLLNPNTVNTMRIITLIDPISQEPFIARAVQRIGVEASAPMDNFTRGGLSVPIDMETGELGSGACHPKTQDYVRYEKHPETGIEFKGMRIPDWDFIKEEILNGAKKLPMLKCVGWDFLLGENGLVAIEGNHHPDPDVLQAHSPLLLDNKIKSFYKYYNILD